MSHPLSDEEIRALLAKPSTRPPSAALLGMEVLDFSAPEKWVELAFTPQKTFANPTGAVQGGFVVAMLDDAMGLAASLASRFTVVVPTLQLNAVFHAPTPVERVLARGEVVRLGKTTALLQAVLRTQTNTVLARATASAAVRPHRFGGPA